MASVIGVRFRNAGKLYYFSPGAFWPTAGDAVIVETVRGMEYGEVVTGVQEVSDDLIQSSLVMVGQGVPQDNLDCLSGSSRSCATSDQTQHHNQDQQQRDNLLHYLSSRKYDKNKNNEPLQLQKGTLLA